MHPWSLVQEQNDNGRTKNVVKLIPSGAVRPSRPPLSGSFPRSRHNPACMLTTGLLQAIQSCRRFSLPHISFQQIPSLPVPLSVGLRRKHSNCCMGRNADLTLSSRFLSIGLGQVLKAFIQVQPSLFGIGFASLDMITIRVVFVLSQ